MGIRRSQILFWQKPNGPSRTAVLEAKYKAAEKAAAAYRAEHIAVLQTANPTAEESLLHLEAVKLETKTKRAYTTWMAAIERQAKRKQQRAQRREKWLGFLQKVKDGWRKWWSDVKKVYSNAFRSFKERLKRRVTDAASIKNPWLRWLRTMQIRVSEGVRFGVQCVFSTAHIAIGAVLLTAQAIGQVLIAAVAFVLGILSAGINAIIEGLQWLVSEIFRWVPIGVGLFIEGLTVAVFGIAVALTWLATRPVWLWNQLTNRNRKVTERKIETPLVAPEMAASVA